MTFYEAALDVLRKEGKPLHYEEITRRALDQGLLSHVGRLPTEIMLARLLAMAQRDEGKSVAVVEPGVFGLAEWGVVQDEASVAATEPEAPDMEPRLRSRERTPMTLAEKKSAREGEKHGRLDAEDKEARSRSRRRRRRPKKDETRADALAAIVNEIGGGPIDLVYVVEALPRQGSLPEDMPSSIEDLKALAQEENDRRRAEDLQERFILEADRIALAPQAPAKPEPPPSVPEEGPAVVRREDVFAAAGSRLLEVMRSLPHEKLERLLLELSARHSLTDAKVAKRSAKGSPLFTGMVRPGASQMRVAVRMLVSGRDVRADDVEEVRGDLENYGAAAGVVLTLGRVARGARTKAEDMSQKPVLLFDGESLALACVKAGLGVRTRLEETVEVYPQLLDSLGSS